MGCDIHFYVEKKINGQWVSQDTWTREDADESDSYLTVPYGQAYYSGRNYDLFAILADVRNGRGFAGIKTGEGFTPIAEPKGVPEDASAEVKEIVARWEGDGHSHSHLTLKELLEFDWTQTTRQEGWVELSTWASWKAYNKFDEGPREYCSSVGGGSIRHLDEQDAFELFSVNGKNFETLDWETRQKVFKENKGVYVHTSWNQSYHSCAETFWSKTIPMLLKLAGSLEAADDVRAVFFFDN